MLPFWDKYWRNHYGGRRGFVLYWIYKTFMWLGIYRRQSNIDWSRVDRVVFVCMGNICRSPVAGAIARAEGYRAYSVGLNCSAGVPADERASEHARFFGVDLNTHGATPFTDFAFTERDLVVAMEPMHWRHPDAQAMTIAQKTLLGLWHRKPNPYIHDPFQTSDEYYQLCEQRIVEATAEMLSHAKHARLSWNPSTP